MPQLPFGFLLAFASLTALATAATPPSEAPPSPATPPGANEGSPAENQTEAPKPPPLKEISPGVYQIGKMRLDKKAGTLSFPTTLNMDDGLIEYMLVSPQGATHESILATDVNATDIHFAMLLLGAKGAPPQNKPPALPASGQIDIEFLRSLLKPQGDSITLSVKWAEKGKVKTAPLEDWLMNSETKKSMERGPWLYTGSIMDGKNFAAQSEGNFIAVINSPTALINNPRDGNDNDKVWHANADHMPAKNTAVELTITLAKPAAPKTPQK